MRCELCQYDLDFHTLDERQSHYEAHFAQDTPNSPSSSLPHQPSNFARRKSAHTPSPSSLSSTFHSPPPPKQNVFWHAFQDAPPPKNYTPCLIPILRRTFTKLHARGLSTKVVLCSDGVCHVGTEWFDIGWGCGYRNFLMACTSLIVQQRQPMYFPLLDRANGSVSTNKTGQQEGLTGPGVRGLQAWIQDAWHEGYDREGASDDAMNWTLVGTRKFIGTTDISVAFTRCGIPCSLVDFPKPKHKSGGSRSSRLKPNASLTTETSATALTRWIVNYFDNVPQPGMPDGLESNRAMASLSSIKSPYDRIGSDGVIVSDRMPIILQHNGHSRSIIGYEKMKSGSVNLLIFDPAPGKRPESAIRNAALALHRASRPLSQTSTSTSTSSTSNSSSPSGLARKAGQLVQTIKHHLSTKSPTAQISRKRNNSLGAPMSSDNQCSDRPVKRVRGGLMSSSNVINDDDDRLGGDGSRSVTRDSILRAKMAMEFESEDDEIIDLSTPKPPSSSGLPNLQKKDKSEARKEADALINGLDPVKVARQFRVNNASLSRKDQYQILFFPLSDPLTEHQKEKRKVVTSAIIHPD